MDDNFSSRVKDVITYSKEEALRLGHDFIGTEHLLLGMLRDGGGKAINILNSLEIDLDYLRKKVEILSPPNPINDFNQNHKKNLHLTRQAERALKTTFLEAKLFQGKSINTAHLLLCILRNENDPTTKLLIKLQLDYESVKEQFKYMLTELNDDFSSSPTSETFPDESKDNEDPIEENPFTIKSDSKSKVKSKTPVLDNFGRDLTSLANSGKLDPVIGREKEIERVSQILSRRKKNNPLLIGEPGVGKSAIAEGLALRIIQKKVSRILYNKRVVTLDLASIVAGTKYRGQFEERMKAVMNEIEKNDDIILFIEETLEILRNIKDQYESHHNVNFTDKALEACVKLTDRYISDRFFPDKAIDAMDEAGSRVHITNMDVPKNIVNLEVNLEEVRDKKNAVVKKQKYEEAAKLRDDEKRIEKELIQAQEKWQEELKMHRETVDENDISEVVSMITGIPVNKIAKAELKELNNLNNIISSKVIGQKDAVSKVVKAIQRNRAGIKDPNKPIGSFIFLGQTGVGKTQLAKILSSELFSGSDSLIRIDMSEYMEKFAVSRLIGAPPGYVGYEEGGQLTEKVRRKPYSVILLDEVEKAHPDIFNMLLQVLDEGSLTDSLGRKVDFKNTVIIMTSNLGARQVKDFGNGVGFGTESMKSQESKNIKNTIEKSLKKAFSPEFLNRVDEIVIFNSLEKDDLKKIINIELEKLKNRLKELGYEIKISSKAINFLCDKGFDKKYGARPLKRAIQNYVEDLIAEEIVKSNIKDGSKFKIECNKDNSKLSVIKL